MAATRIGINGFGRMGRLALRAAWGWPDIAFVHVNEITGDPSTAAHLLTFDSVHGRWLHDARGADQALVIDGQDIGYTAAAQPGDVPWEPAGVDVVLECSGQFRTRETLDAYFVALTPSGVPTSSGATSAPRSAGSWSSLTSPTCAAGRGLCSSRSCSTCSPARSSVGSSRPTEAAAGAADARAGGIELRSPYERPCYLVSMGWVGWYNNTRLHGELGDIPPVEYERNAAAGAAVAVAVCVRLVAGTLVDVELAARST